MSWILFAVVGHLLNAGAFVIDKVLLTSAFKKSSSYAAMIGGISLAVIVALPWVKEWPSDALLPIVAAFGALFVFALWSFFEALKHGEASRVVPIVGSAIPIFTVIGTTLVLHERLTTVEWVGFALLLIATVILSSGSSKKRLSVQSICYGVLSAVLFAVASVCGKYAFEQSSFLSVFVLSRVAAGFTGLVIAFVVPGTLAELKGMMRPAKGSKRVKSEGLVTGRRAAIFALIGQVSGALGFVGVTMALSQGSASLVNALQATQYAFIVFVTWLGGERLRTLLHEEWGKKVIILKSLAILLVGIGLACISRSQ